MVLDERSGPGRTAADDASQEMSEDGDALDGIAVSRPPGFTRAVREFHRLLVAVQAPDLTAADRAALRALFRDLAMLARASTTLTPRVFPPLPRSSARRGRDQAARLRISALPRLGS